MVDDLVNEIEWRCRGCKMLLGIERSGTLHVRYKAAQYLCRGTVAAICRNCSELNEYVCPAGTPKQHIIP